MGGAHAEKGVQGFIKLKVQVPIGNGSDLQKKGSMQIESCGWPTVKRAGRTTVERVQMVEQNQVYS